MGITSGYGICSKDEREIFMTEEETFGKHPLFIASKEAGKRLSDAEEKTKEARILWEQNGSICGGEFYHKYNKRIEELLIASKEFDIAWRTWAEERKK